MVSIIVNCFNGEQYLKDALESIENQTFKDYEIIFWDNCSTDNSVHIAEQFKGNIKILRGTTFVGLGEARNLAINHACGEYIAFLDCDDLWRADKLEKQVEILDKNEEIDLVTTNFTIINMINGCHSQNKWNITMNTGGLHELIIIGSVSTSACMIRKSAIQAFSYVFNPNLKYTMDFELYSRIAMNSNIFFINELLTSYRVHKSMTTKSLQGLVYEEYNILLNSIRESHPLFNDEHPEDIRQLEFTRDFLEAKYLLSNKKKKRARDMVKPYVTNPKALILFCLSCLPLNFVSSLLKLLYKRR